MELRDLILKHVHNRPLLQIQDVYKMLHQSTHGIGHILNEHAKTRLIQEMSGCIVHNGEFLLENIDTCETLVRVNLRPFQAKYSPKTMPDCTERLWSTMMESQIVSHPQRLDILYNEFINICEQKMFPPQIRHLDADSARIFGKRVREHGYPPVHHSQEYRDIYNPSYRVVKKEVFVERFPDWNQTRF